MAGTLVITTLSDGTNSTSSTNCIQGSAKAWVNFNGTGTVAIRASYNVSSITDNGTGDYTVNFTNALADANYSFVISCGVGTAGYRSAYGPNVTTPTTTACTIRTGEPATGASADVAFVNVAVFR